MSFSEVLFLPRLDLVGFMFLGMYLFHLDFVAI